MPRSSSTVISPQIAGPPRSFQPSPQVPKFLSPGCGTARKRHTSLPVLTSNACGSPGGPTNAFSPSRAAEDREVLVDRRRRRHREAAAAESAATAARPTSAAAARRAATAAPPAAPPRTRVGVAGRRRHRRHRRPAARDARRRRPCAEALDRLAGRRIERPQLVAGAVEQPGARVLDRPASTHGAHRSAAHRRLEAPQLLAGLGLERHDAAVLQRDVHRGADDDRRVLPLAARHLGVELPGLGRAGATFSGVICVSVEKRVCPGIVAVGLPVVLRDDRGTHNGAASASDGPCRCGLRDESDMQPSSHTAVDGTSSVRLRLVDGLPGARRRYGDRPCQDRGQNRYLSRTA